MSARRLYAPVVLALLAVGGLAFLAATRTWAEATVEAKGLLPDEVAVTGRDVVPGAAALALVVVAAALAVLAASVRVRRVVGVLVAVVSVVGCVLALTADVTGAAFTQVVEESTAYTGTNFPDVVEQSVWRPVTAGAFVVTAVLGAVVAWLSGRWPTMGRRYEAPASHSRRERAAHDDESAADMWKALDEGRDPTQ